MELIFATNNSHKLFEVKEKLRLSDSDIRIISLSEIGFSSEIPETGTTLQENARQKMQTIYDFSHRNCFADDSGLEIEALNGEPGVYSSHYAERNNTVVELVETPVPVRSENNINLVLSKMQGKTNRRACFKTVIALILNGEIYYFEGRVDGEITTEKHGVDGFGYDPIFRPDGYNETFAELALEEKNRISHRGRAVDELVKFLSEIPASATPPVVQ